MPDLSQFTDTELIAELHRREYEAQQQAIDVYYVWIDGQRRDETFTDIEQAEALVREVMSMRFDCDPAAIHVQGAIDKAFFGPQSQAGDTAFAQILAYTNGGRPVGKL